MCVCAKNVRGIQWFGLRYHGHIVRFPVRDTIVACSLSAFADHVPAAKSVIQKKMSSVSCISWLAYVTVGFIMPMVCTGKFSICECIVVLHYMQPWVCVIDLASLKGSGHLMLCFVGKVNSAGWGWSSKLPRLPTHANLSHLCKLWAEPVPSYLERTGI